VNIILKVWLKLKRVIITLLLIPQLFFVSYQMAIDKLRGRKIIILYIEELGFIQYILPIVESLKKHESFLSYYIATNYKKYDDELSPFNVSKNKIFNPTISSWLCLANIFLSASVYGKGPKSAYRVNVSHNFPVKVETYPRDEVIKYDVHFLTGPTQRDQFENMFNKFEIDIKTVQMLDIGYPKLDDLLNGDYVQENILNELGLDAEKPTILYAPSWDPGASLRSFGDQLIKELLQMDEVNIIVKLHPVSYTPESSPNFEFYTGGINWNNKLSKYEHNQNFRNIVEYSLNPFLAASDIMVSDVSSSALEFIILDKPVIFVDCPEFFNTTLKKLGQDPDLIRNDVRYNAGRNAGIVINDLSNLKEAIIRSLNHPHEFSEKRKTLSDQILYNPGKGSITSAQKILDLLELN
jgi:hypothetical protein